MKRSYPWVVALALACVLPSLVAADPVILVASNSVWKYLDDGSNQGTAWRDLGFNDTAWPSGTARLGYGGDGEVTTVSFGPDPNNKYTTTYFRRVFNVPDASIFQSARAGVVRDDGAVVYVNGVEVFRTYMPEGPIAFNTFSLPVAVGGADELTYFPGNFSPSILVSGPNVVAVEVHQVNLTSSDLGFDLELAAGTDPVLNSPPTAAILSPPDTSSFAAPGTISISASASDSDGTVQLVEFYEGANKLGQDATSPYDFTWFSVPLGNYDLTVVATDNLGAKTTSAVVRVSVVTASTPFVASKNPAPGNVSTLNSITVTFSKAVVGVVPEYLLINGLPALTLSGSGSVYTFGFNQPAPGPVSVMWDIDHSIVDLSGLPFDDLAPASTWSYVLADGLAPVAAVTPSPGSVVTALGQVSVLFNEPVTGVNAGDLTMNSEGASSVTGSGAGPYLFNFTAPAAGTVIMAWAGSHGIADLAPVPNAFGGGVWSYTLNPGLVRDVVINEILADNLTSLADEDQQKQDWIELRNRGGSPVSLLGWSLTDDPDLPGKWVLPNVTVGAGQYLVIFASGKNRATTAPGTTNHVNFQLAIGGGYLGLFNANWPRQVVSQFSPGYPELRGNISYGLKANGAPAWFSTLTPGGPNADASALAGIVQPPHPSVNSGTFTHAFDVVLSCPTPGARVFYTLDGSSPTPSSPEYFGPIPINGTPRKGAVALRAGAFLTGHLPSLVTTRTYIFPEHVLTQPANPDQAPALWDSPGGLQDSLPDYEMDSRVVNGAGNRPMILAGLQSIPTLSIVTDSNRIWSPSEGFYVRKTYDDDSLGAPLVQPCNAELIFPDGSEEGFNVTAGIRVVGGTSPDNQGTFPTAGWKSRKLSMRLIFRGDHGATKLRYKVFPDSAVDQFDTLVLDAGLNNVWTYNGGSDPDGQRRRAEYCRDQYMSDLQNALGGVAPHGRHVHVYLNGLYWGLHGFHERPDESFAADYLGGDKSEYDVLKHNLSAANVVSGVNTIASVNQLFTLARSGLVNNSVYEQLQQVLDVPAFADYMIANAWGANTDWPHQNWYLSKRRSPTGKWRFHSWDAEHVLETKSTTTPYDDPDPSSPGELLSLLRANAEFKLLFADHVQRHFFNGGTFYVDPSNPVYDANRPERNRPAALYMKRLGFIHPNPLMAESARWGDTAQTGSPASYVPLTITGPFRDEIDSLLGIRQTTTAPHGAVWRYFVERSDFSLTQWRNLGLYPTVSAPSFNQHGGRVASGFAVTMSAPGGAIYYTVNGTDPRIYGAGTAAPDAQLYAAGSPPVLTGTTRIKARAFSGGLWSALNEADFIVEDLTVPVRITEIMYNPEGGDAHEFIELRHVGQVAVDLSGYTFEGIGFTFLSGSSLAPGATIVLANNNNPTSFAARYPGVAVSGYFSGNLANGGEIIALRDPLGRLVLSVAYNDENGWPTQPDGHGPSLELADEESYSSDPASWRASLAAHGTPGLPPASVPPGAVVLNEVAAENLGSVPNLGTLPDWVEIRNGGEAPVDLGGWSLSDGPDPRRYVFPSPTVVGPGGYLVVWCDLAGTPTPGLHAGFGLDREGDGVFLYDRNTNRVDAVTFGKLPADYTLGRAGGEWGLNTPTPGEDNVAAALAAASNLGINEWMAAPVTGEKDWLELYNRSASAPVALKGVYLGTSNALFQVRSHSFIPPRGYVQLFAEEGDGANELGFKLPAPGGAIVLYSPAGVELERVTYGPQSAGVSSGRLPDGFAGSVLAFPGSTSPAAANFLQAYSGPQLVEVLARNAAAATAPWGGYADFVELHNAGAAAFDLGGMRLSTSMDDPDAYIIPAGVSLGVNGRLVLWCDDSQPPTLVAGAALNTGFSLPGGGGGVYLFTASGQIATGVDFGNQIPDLPLGRVGSAWLLLTAATPGAPNAAAAALGPATGLRINEWMADPNGGSDWFELYNTGALPVKMDGLFVTDDPSVAGLAKSPIRPLSFIGAGGWARWEADGNPGQGPNHSAFSLDGAGEALVLYNTDGNLIDAVSFGQQLGGASQGRLPDGGAQFVTFATTASPEESNFLPVPAVVVNEVLSHTDSPLEDAVELFNTSASQVDLSGWYLSDGSDNFKKYQIPNGTLIQPGGYLVFYQYQLNGGPGSLAPFTFDSVRGDRAWVSQAAGAALTGYRARAAFGASANGVSFGRFATTVGVDFVAQTGRSFGEDNPADLGQFRSGTGRANPGPRIGPVVFNEIMYHPDAPGGVENPLDEYVELCNITDTGVPLFDTAHAANTWRLAGGVQFQFPQDAALPRRSYALVVSFDPVADQASLALFRARYGVPDTVRVFGPYQGALADGGETLELQKPDPPQGPGPDEGYVPYVTVDLVSYGDQTPWPAEADGGGASLQRRRPRDYGNDPVNWKAQTTTAGRANVSGYGYDDFDHDGMPDDYEVAQSFDPSNPSDGAQDTDGDGRSNEAEFLDGTNPRSAASVLMAPAVTSQPQSLVGIPGGSAVFGVTATGTAPLQYQWHANGLALAGENGPSLTLNNLNPGHSGRYHVVVWNMAGYALSAAATLAVNVPPRITAQPQSLSLSNGLTATFTVGATGTGQLRYQWRRNGQDIGGATGLSFTIVNIQLSDDGDYTVRVQDDLAAIESDPARLKVLLAPSFTRHPLGQTVVVGSDVTFTVGAIGTLPITYRWRQGSTTLKTDVTNSFASTLTLSNILATDGGTTKRITCVIANEVFPTPGSLSQAALLTVLPDADGDGIDDAYESGHGLNPNDAGDGSGDQDMDGLSNVEEYQCGTDPLDPQSYLKIGIRGPEAVLVLRAVALRSYTIEYRDELDAGDWLKLLDVEAEAADRDVQVNDPGVPAVGRRAYRLVTPKKL